MTEKTTGWTEYSDDSLHKLAQLGKIGIPLPTSAKFNADQWISLREKYPDDAGGQLIDAAVFFGQAMQAARTEMARFTRSWKRERALDLTLAALNSVFEEKRRFFHVSRAKERSSFAPYNPTEATRPLELETGQTIDFDSLATSMVDALPHVLFQMVNLPDGEIDPSLENFDFVSLIQLGAFESVYRNLWLEALWESYTLDPSNEGLKFISPSREYAGMWVAWEQHYQMQAIEKFDRSGHGRLPTEGKLDVTTIMPPRCCERVTWDGSSIRTRLSESKTQRTIQRQAAQLIGALSIRQLEHFLDVKVSPDQQISYRDLCKAWLALGSLANGLIQRFPRKIDENWNYECSISALELNKFISDTCAFDGNKSAECIDFLTLKFEDWSSVFRTGLWDRPLLQNGDRYAVCLPPLVIGNSLRTFELWLRRTKKENLKGSGFEREAMERVRLALANRLDGLTRKGSWGPSFDFKGEDIDFAIQLNDRIIVCEAKCFAGAADPIERHNLMSSLKSAAEQAKRKADFVRLNLADFKAKFEIKDDINHVHPLVVLPSGQGAGLIFEDTPTVEISFLKILLSSLDMGIGLIFTGEKAEYHTKTIYTKGYFNFLEFFGAIRSPYQIRRFLENYSYSMQPYPVPGETKLFLMMPDMEQRPAPHMSGSVEKMVKYARQKRLKRLTAGFRR